MLVLAIVVLASCFALWRLRLSHDVRNRLAAIRSAGLPTSGTELDNWYAHVPDSENAALVMTQALALLREFPDSRSNNLTIPPRGQPLTVAQRQLLSDYVEMNSNALAKADEAIRLPKSRYPVNLGLGVEAEFPHLAPAKKLARTAQFEALLEIESGQAVDADNSIRRILGIGRTLDDEPETISWLVRNSIIRMAVAMLERRLNLSGTSESEPARLASDFASCEKTNLLARTLIAGRAMAIPYFPASTNQLLLFRLSGVFERDLRFFLGVMETNVALTSLPPPQSFAIDYHTNFYREIEHNLYPASAMFLPELSKAVVAEAKYLADTRLAITALAIERFRTAIGRLPENLTELTPTFLSSVPIDPFDGRPLRYHHLPKGYVIYSIDRDRRDDGGREKPAHIESTDETSYDITFIVER